LFAVLGELDLRAQRDPVVRSMMDRYQQGWHAALADLLRRGAKERAWSAQVDVGSGVEPVIAVVKGVRLVPDQAETVLRQFERVLASTGTQEAEGA
jgi:hypothetical protein